MNDFAAELSDLPVFLAAHLRLTLVALSVGLAISLPLGILATRRPKWEATALGIASVIQTVPGLALLALMIPGFAWLGGWMQSWGGPPLPSIGFLPAVTALSLYSVLPMLRGTITGIASVDPAMREAARGVGMNPRELLWQVELPLALPILVSGIRTATVWVVGMATLATPVGAESLGNPIFAGLQTRNTLAVLAGSLAAAILALLLDGLVRGLEVGIHRRSRAIVLTAFFSLVLIAVGAMWPVAQGRLPSSSERPDPVEIVIGSKPFTEQYILAEVLGKLVEGPDTRVRQVPSLGSTVAFDGLHTGELDAYIDYSGTIWATILKASGAGGEREEVLETVRRRLAAEYGIEIAAVLGFENTYALAVRGEAARADGLGRISDLMAIASDRSIAGDYEFFERPEWRSLVEGYGLSFAEQRAMDSSLMYDAIASGAVDVISAYSTDGRIAALDLVVLEDDRRVIPPYDALVLVSARLASKAPEARAALARLDGRIDVDSMRAMNAAVDLDGRRPGEVARAWIAGNFQAAPSATGLEASGR